VHTPAYLLAVAGGGSSNRDQRSERNFAEFARIESMNFISDATGGNYTADSLCSRIAASCERLIISQPLKWQPTHIGKIMPSVDNNLVVTLDGCALPRLCHAGRPRGWLLVLLRGSYRGNAALGSTARFEP
jgi:hypothetical protein